MEKSKELKKKIKEDRLKFVTNLGRIYNKKKEERLEDKENKWKVKKFEDFSN